MAAKGFKVLRTPQQARLGQQLQRGLSAPASVLPPGATWSNERPLNYQFTALKTLHCTARQIPYCDATIGGGQTAWFCFAQWRVGDNLAPGFLNGYRFELGGTNPDSAGDEDFTGAASEFTAWGTGDGFGAAIAITVNSPYAQRGAWREGPAYVPYVNEGAAVAQNWNNSGESEAFYLHFAAGRQADRPRPFVARVSQTTPLAIVLSPGDVLSVSFVGRKDQVTTNTLWGLIMRVYGELYISSLLATRSIMQ